MATKQLRKRTTVDAGLDPRVLESTGGLLLPGTQTLTPSPITASCHFQGDKMAPHMFREQLRKVFNIKLTPTVSGLALERPDTRYDRGSWHLQIC